MDEYQQQENNCLQKVFHAIDWFGVPVASTITYKGNRRITTVCGGLCSFVMAFFVFWYGILILKAASENDQPNYTATSLQSSVTGSTPVSIAFDDVIVAYKPSLDISYMLGVFYAIEIVNNQTVYTPFGAVPCNTIYNATNMPDVWALINDDGYWCLDTTATALTGFQPQQEGSDVRFILQVNTCTAAIGNYWYLSGGQVWPYAKPVDGDCLDPFDQNADIVVELKMITKILDWGDYSDKGVKNALRSDDILSYYVDLYQRQSFINNVTESTVDINLQKQEVYLGENSIYNTNNEGSFQRSNFNTYNNLFTNFNFINSRGYGMPGGRITYNTFNFMLSAYKTRTIVDTKMTMPIVLFQIGGFAFCWWLISFALLWLLNYFNANNEIVNSLYSFTAPTRDVQDVVSGRRQLGYSFFQWVLCCLGNEKRELYRNATEAKEKELDIVHICNAWRTTRFLCEIQPDPAFCRLIKYSADYKVGPTDHESTVMPVPATPEDQHNLDVRLAGQLNNNTRLHQTLVNEITGVKAARTAQQHINMSNSASADQEPLLQSDEDKENSL